MTAGILTLERTTRLKGKVQIQGAKASSQNILPATIVLPGKYTLHNVPDILNTAYMLDILKYLGGEIRNISRNSIFIDTRYVEPKPIPIELTSRSYSSFLFAGALLSRFGIAQIAPPIGDQLGARPVNWHLDAFRQLGASVHQEIPTYHITFDKVADNDIYLPKVSTVGGTVNAIFAAIGTKKRIKLHNVALEPEIDDLLKFLKEIGIEITRARNNSIIINSIFTSQFSTEFEIMPDRVDASTFAIAAILCRGPVILENIRPEHMMHVIKLVEQIGGITKIFINGDDEICLSVECSQIKHLPLEITSGRYPAFPTDCGPLVQVLMTQIEGESIFHETIFPKRFFHISELKRMGADIKYFNPQKHNLLYVFDASAEIRSFHSIKIKGRSRLNGCPVHVHDIRAGAALVLAGLIATGKTKIHGANQISRGYENFDSRLAMIGASIEFTPNN